MSPIPFTVDSAHNRQNESPRHAGNRKKSHERTERRPGHRA
jgi:hypothetical protein